MSLYQPLAKKNYHTLDKRWILKSIGTICLLRRKTVLEVREEMQGQVTVFKEYK